jgi:hypothetical protein
MPPKQPDECFFQYEIDCHLTKKKKQLYTTDHTPFRQLCTDPTVATIWPRCYTIDSCDRPCAGAMVMPSFRNKIISISERRNSVQEPYRFVQSWLIVGIVRAPRGVCSDCLVHGSESDGSLSCLRLGAGFILSKRR